MNAPDLTLVLPGGGELKTYAAFVTFGSPVLRAALPESRGDAAAKTIEIPLNVCEWGFGRAIDELLPEYLRTTTKISKFNPFKKAHRDYLTSLHYICAPHFEKVVNEISIENVTSNFNRDGLLFCAAHPGRLGDGALTSLLSSVTGAADQKVCHELLRLCIGDDEATSALQTVLGRLLFQKLEGQVLISEAK